ncbi:thiamine pyrophosphate-dependent enzyme [Bacteroidota bacterium]
MATDVVKEDGEGLKAEVSIQEVQEGHTNGSYVRRISVADIGYEGDLEIVPVGPEDFEPEMLLGVFRSMVLARNLDKKMLTLLKQGKGFFHIGTSGHEAAQLGIALHARKGYDWTSSYYRDMTYCMALGITTRQVLLAHFSKADDITSGGRQMPEHFASPELRMFLPSSSVGAQYLPAVGLASAVRRHGEDAFVYASGGEGSTSQGAFPEALNWAARERLPVLFHVQDNGYAISVPRDEQTAGASVYKTIQGFENLATCRLDGTDFFQTWAVGKAAVERLRRGDGPVCIVAEVVRLLPHSSSDSHAKYRSEAELAADLEFDPIVRFEQRLLEADVATTEQLEAIRLDVKREIDEEAKWASAQPDPDPATAERHVFFEGDLGLEYEQTVPSGEPVVMVDAINHALHEEMRRDPTVLVYGEDVAGGKGGVFTVTRNLTAEFGESRCFNAPLAENSIIGTAAGLAVGGFRPVIEIQFADYIWPGMQPLRNVIASYRYRSNGAFSCPVVIRVPVGGYIHGGPYHSQNIEAIFGHMPGLKIAIPSTAADAKGLLKTAIRGLDPVLFLEHKWLYRQPIARTPEPDADYLLPFGKARIVQEGSDLTVVTYGAMVYKTMDAVRSLEKDGASVEVIDLRTVVPLDIESVIASVRKTNRILVVHEDHEFLGLGAEICAQVADKAFEHLDAPARRVAGRFTPIPFADPLERAVLPNEGDIVTAARSLLAF